MGIGYLKEHEVGDRELKPMLEAALDREYSANPNEIFFTGGGAHHFNNFEKNDNGRTVQVREAVRKSINLPFVRIIRDVAYYFTAQIPHAQEMLVNLDDPARREYLTRFANKEGREFLGHFYLRYRGMASEDVLAALLLKSRKSAKHLGAIFAVVFPAGSAHDFADFLTRELPPGVHVTDRMVQTIYDEVHRSGLTLQDKGYIAGLHPLELWLVAFMVKQPRATFTQIMEASTQARQEAYQWLFSSRGKLKQDRRIKIMLEEDAFAKIHTHWARLGYPFATLVPTYATALGSSGDKPIALADLMSIVVAGGMQYANTRVTQMDFAEGTPFETRFRAKFDAGTRVLSADIADTVRMAIRQVVESGTAQRVKGAFKYADGSLMPIGGKTGTGDNRYSIFAPGGRVIESKIMSRTATFVFYIGEHFFGTLTAYVPNAAASEFNFTSALPVQVLKVIAPRIMPLIQRADELAALQAKVQGINSGDTRDHAAASPAAQNPLGSSAAKPEGNKATAAKAAKAAKATKAVRAAAAAKAAKEAKDTAEPKEDGPGPVDVVEPEAPDEAEDGPSAVDVTVPQTAPAPEESDDAETEAGPTGQADAVPNAAPDAGPTGARPATPAGSSVGPDAGPKSVNALAPATAPATGTSASPRP